MGERIADSQTYKALENLAKAANTWKQWKRNMPPQQGRELLRELAARNSDLANSPKSGSQGNSALLRQCSRYFGTSTLAFPANERVVLFEAQKTLKNT